MPEEIAGKRIFVTGATGFLGSHLVPELQKAGAVVYGLRRKATAGMRLGGQEPSWLEGDLLDRPSLKSALSSASPDIVFHLAAYGTTSAQNDPSKTFRVNVEGTWNLWECLPSSVRRLVYLGTSGEYGQAKGLVSEDHPCRPTWFYPAAKHAAVTLLSSVAQDSEREVVTLRPYGPFGPGDDPSRIIPHTIATLLRKERLDVTLGEQLRDFLFVEDHVRAIVAAGTKPLPGRGLVYNIGSGRPFQLRALIEKIADAVSADARELIRFGGVPYRQSEVWEMCCDISAARRDLGFSPRVALEEGILRTLEWYRRNLP